MVRHGRLSKGCQTCRKRKIKCDQALPSCSQCRKAGWVCPQYGDAVERMFLHQDTDSFKRQQKGPCREAQILRPAEEALTRTYRDGCQIALWNDVPDEIRQSVNDRAIEYFLLTHTFRDDGALRGFYEYLPTYGDIQADKELLTMLTATALAAFGNRFKHADILKQARHYYGRSLRLVNRALQSPIKARRDSTMISILLLNTFEGLTSEGRSSMVYSDGHMRGELMIMSLRGPSLMASRLGMQLFLHMCRCLITYCTIRPAHVPAEVIELRKHAAKLLDTNSPAWVLEEIMIKLANFRADVKDDGILGDPRRVIDSALQLDNEILNFSNNIPHEWRFTVHDSKQSPETRTLTYYHVYPDLWVAYTWNYIRACRLLLHKEVKNQFGKSVDDLGLLSAEALRFRQHSSQTVHQLVLDICASVPQYCDGLSTRTSHCTKSLPVTKEHAASPVPTIAGVYFLIWPLWTAGDTTQSLARRDWIIKNCRSIGQMTGIQRMRTVAESMERGEYFV
ncbi:hypothetical protein BDV12DRAFT_57300 [Aspergillus spectabilis]